MSRVIKFRFWLIEERNMLNAAFKFDLIDGQYFVYRNGLEWYESIALLCVPMQFIGIKDKNGKEIYEGDITNNGTVRYINCLHWEGGGSQHPGFYFSWNEADEMELDYHDGFTADIEVIGNIYENPELLK